MKCIRCQHDSKYPERPNRICPGCHKPFAFEPRQGDPFTDAAFQSALEAVSAGGRLRWGVENLYYELARRKRGPVSKAAGKPWGCLVAWSVVFGISQAALGLTPLTFILLGVLVLGAVLRRGWRLVSLKKETFDPLFSRWCDVHGKPAGMIARRPKEERLRKPAEPDLYDYSFDRAVICDRARTVDLLIANNFHFENNCAVLSVTGYPESAFEPVRRMLKKNPRLQVFALHDATPQGCRMAQRLARDPAWFKGLTVTDVGLRPKHHPPFLGLLMKAETGAVTAGDGLTPEEAAWLARYQLELAAIRPEQVLKRLFRALNQARDGAGTGKERRPEREGEVWYDEDSFSQDAGDSDAGADSFG